MAGTQVSGDCFNGTGKWRFEDGATYEGKWKNHKFHGKGVIHYADGAVLEASFTNGQIKGASSTSVYTAAGGGRYTGRLVGGKMEGGGELACTFFDETKFIGGCTSKGPDGHAKVNYFNSDEAECHWKDGQKHGADGTHKYSNGDSYRGPYANGRKHGRGIYTFADGARYEGQFVNGEMVDGDCVFVLANGTTYYGCFNLSRYAASGGYRNSADDTWSYPSDDGGHTERADGSEGAARHTPAAGGASADRLGGFDDEPDIGDIDVGEEREREWDGESLDSGDEGAKNAPSTFLGLEEGPAISGGEWDGESLPPTDDEAPE